MAKYCAKCGKPLPNGVEICPDCSAAAQETDAALFTRMNAETEVWKTSEDEKKSKRQKVQKSESPQQKLLYGAAAVLVLLFVVFALLFTRPASRVTHAIDNGDYDRAMEIYWGTTGMAERERAPKIDNAIMKAAERLCTQYANHEIDADTAATALSKLGTFGDGAEEMLADTYAEFRTLSGSQSHMTQAEKSFRNGEYMEAREEYLQVVEEDSDYSVAMEKAESCLTQYAESVLSDASVFIQSGDYASAILTLETGKKTLCECDAFSEKLDTKLEATYGLFEEFILGEAENLAELGDYQAAAALVDQNMETFELESDALTKAVSNYLEKARGKAVSDAADRAAALYESGSYAEAFAALDGMRPDLEGPTADIDAETVALEERFVADMSAKALALFAGERDNLESAIAVLADALKIRPLNALSEYKEHLESYLPVSLTELEYEEKNGTVFRSSSTFESVGGTNYTGGWIWGENGAELTFLLDGAFDVLTCTLAVRRDDDEEASGHYTVWCDGEKVYESDTLYHWDTAPIAATIDISGCNELKISFTVNYSVSTAENGFCYHGLCNPTLTKNLNDV